MEDEKDLKDEAVEAEGSHPKMSLIIRREGPGKEPGSTELTDEVLSPDMGGFVVIFTTQGTPGISSATNLQNAGGVLLFLEEARVRYATGPIVIGMLQAESEKRKIVTPGQAAHKNGRGFWPFKK